MMKISYVNEKADKIEAYFNISDKNKLLLKEVLEERFNKLSLKVEKMMMK